MTLRELLTTAPPSVSRRDAETLLLHLLEHDRAWLLAHPHAHLSTEPVHAWRGFIARRAQGEPLQYLTGHQEFFGLNLLVTPDVLIPRPETEHLVEVVLAWAQKQHETLHIADVGTGSGAITLALAAHLPQAHFTALDLSEAALRVARQNAVRLELSDRVRFVQSDLLERFEPGPDQGERLDAIVSNPPYIPTGDAAELAPEVRDHEPALALFAEADGMAIYRRLLPAAARALRPGGLLAMEFGFGQRASMQELFVLQPPGTWNALHFTSDLQEIPRVVEAVRL